MLCHVGPGERSQPARELGYRERENVAGRVAIVHDHERKHAQERQQAARERVQEERDRRPLAVGAAPEADQEKERNQRELEENVKEHHVQAGEEPKQPRFQRQQERVIERGSFRDRFPRGADRRDHEHGRQLEEPEAQAVKPQREADVGA